MLLRIAVVFHGCALLIICCIVGTVFESYVADTAVARFGSYFRLLSQCLIRVVLLHFLNAAWNFQMYLLL